MMQALLDQFIQIMQFLAMILIAYRIRQLKSNFNK